MVARNCKVKHYLQLDEWYKAVWTAALKDNLMCNVKIKKELLQKYHY